MENAKEFIARRVARELHDGDVVNLGIGLPTLIPAFIPPEVHIILQSENGIVGTAPLTDGDLGDPLHVTDAGGRPTMVARGGAYVDSSVSFGLIRGGHVDCTILGSLEVDAEGNLANWIVPGKMLPGMGGAMDLVVGANRVIVAMEHLSRGRPKILQRCSLPLTAVRCVTDIITDMAVIAVTGSGLVLTEFKPEFSLDQIREATQADMSLSPDLIAMAV